MEIETTTKYIIWIVIAIVLLILSNIIIKTSEKRGDYPTSQETAGRAIGVVAGLILLYLLTPPGFGYVWGVAAFAFVAIGLWTVWRVNNS